MKKAVHEQNPLLENEDRFRGICVIEVQRSRGTVWYGMVIIPFHTISMYGGRVWYHYHPPYSRSVGMVP
jgi:hypothetical protein